MSFPSIERQRGQALLEATFISMIFIILLFSIQYSGHFRTRTLELIGESSYQSFLKSEPNSELNYQRFANDNKRTSKKGELLPIYTKELLNVHGQGMIHVRRATNQVTDSRLASNRLFNAVFLQRTSYLYVQDGHGRSDLEVQSRIGRSEAVWRDVTSPTKQVLKPHIYPLKKIDASWHRGHLQTDWLRGWAGQSPRVSSSKMPLE